MTPDWKPAFRQALDQADRFVGATSPNPPVGAAAIDSEGNLLSVQAHEKAGTGHAEARVIADCRERGLLDRIHTLVVTLEPCNHTGRTPPCAEGILNAGIRRVFYGAVDPNPRVAGGGATRLRAAGVEIAQATEFQEECENLVRQFVHWSTTGLPWVTVKTAHDPLGSMIPPAGAKTFTSPESLKLAHELRKRSDAIITGSGTVLADRPEFTVRHVPDHSGKRRWLIVLDRRKRTPEDWIKSSEQRGFSVRTDLSFEEALEFLGSKGALEVLIEAGPELSQAVLSSSVWNEHVVITQGQNHSPDRIEFRKNVHWHYPKGRRNLSD